LYNALYGWDIDSTVVTNPNAIEAIKSPILSGTTTLPEQERAAGDAARDMGESIAEGAEKANTALTELF